MTSVNECARVQRGLPPPQVLITIVFFALILTATRISIVIQRKYKFTGKPASINKSYQDIEEILVKNTII